MWLYTALPPRKQQSPQPPALHPHSAAHHEELSSYSHTMHIPFTSNGALTSSVTEGTRRAPQSTVPKGKGGSLAQRDLGRFRSLKVKFWNDNSIFVYLVIGFRENTYNVILRSRNFRVTSGLYIHNSRHVTSHVTLPKKFKLNGNTIFSQSFWLNEK